MEVEDLVTVSCKIGVLEGNSEDVLVNFVTQFRWEGEETALGNGGKFFQG